MMSVSQWTPSRARLRGHGDGDDHRAGGERGATRRGRRRGRGRTRRPPSTTPRRTSGPTGTTGRGPRRAAPTSGRSRSTITLIRLTSTSWPIPTAARKSEDLDVVVAAVGDDAGRRQRGDDDRGAAEVGDHLQHVDRRRDGVRGTPLGDLVVELGEPGAGVRPCRGARPSTRATPNDDGEGRREQEAAAAVAVEPLAQEAAHPRMALDRPGRVEGDGLRRRRRRTRRRRRRAPASRRRASRPCQVRSRRSRQTANTETSPRIAPAIDVGEVVHPGVRAGPADDHDDGERRRRR